jgi:hypothetical protein
MGKTLTPSQRQPEAQLVMGLDGRGSAYSEHMAERLRWMLRVLRVGGVVCSAESDLLVTAAA